MKKPPTNPQQPLAGSNMAWLERNGLLQHTAPRAKANVLRDSIRSLVEEILETQATKPATLKDKQRRLIEVLNSAQQPEASTSQAGSNATLAYMRKMNLPLTRETWMDLSYPDGLPEPWTAELEAEVPEQFQDWSRVKSETPTPEEWDRDLTDEQIVDLFRATPEQRKRMDQLREDLDKGDYSVT